MHAMTLPIIFLLDFPDFLVFGEAAADVDLAVDFAGAFAAAVLAAVFAEDDAAAFFTDLEDGAAVVFFDVLWEFKDALEEELPDLLPEERDAVLFFFPADFEELPFFEDPVFFDVLFFFFVSAKRYPFADPLFRAVFAEYTENTLFMHGPGSAPAQKRVLCYPCFPGTGVPYRQ